MGQERVERPKGMKGLNFAIPSKKWGNRGLVAMSQHAEPWKISLSWRSEWM